MVLIILGTDKILVQETGGPQGTALDVACKNGHVGVVKILLEQYNPQDGKDRLYKEALECVILGGHVGLFKAFLEKGCLHHDGHPSIASALLTASRRGHVELVQTILRDCYDTKPPELPAVSYRLMDHFAGIWTRIATICTDSFTTHIEASHTEASHTEA